MDSLGPAVASLAVASAPAALQHSLDARLYVPADLLYSLRLAAGAPALVGVSDCAPDEAAVPLAERFSAAYRLQPALEAAELGVGSCVVAAELWPAQGLAKGTAAPSQVLQNALARPDTGSRLLVFAAPAAETPAASSLAAHGSSSSGSSSSSSICAEVYLRMCSRPAAGGTAAPVLLPLHEEAASSGGGTEQRPATPVPEVQSPATRGRAGAPAALSPAMRGGAAPPVALSPAMRGGVDTPSMPRGRASSTTAQSSGKGAAGQPGQRPGASSSGGGSRAAAAAAREQDRAKAEALLGSLLDQGSGSRVRHMVEVLLLRQLAGRRLLPGNLVALPVFGQRAAFVVEHVERQPASAALASEAGGVPASTLPAPITAATSVRLLLDGEVPPQAGSGAPQQHEDWAALAAAAAAGALGCSLEDAGALAARRAAVAGLASRGITFDQLGGTTKQAQALREMVALPLQAPQLFESYAVAPPRGVLLYGPPGTGKTVLACATAAAAGARFFVINGPDVVSEYFGESESGLRGIFAAATALQPSVIFIDELDALAPARGGGPGGGGKGGGGSGSSARVVSTLLTEMDDLRGGVVVVGATNRVDSLDAALRRPGRFDREVEVGVPSPPERRDILSKLLRSMAHDLTAEQVGELADAAHGFVAADLSALCNEAAMIALRRLVSCSTTNPCVNIADFKAAEARTRPSAMRELAFEIPKVTWSDIGGLDDVKLSLREAVELPFQNPDALARLGIVPPRGILLHGPPGCSKTLLARAVASEARLNFISVKGPELFNKYVGESEKALAALFAKARASSPSIIFFDEIDGLATTRDSSGDAGIGVGERMLSQLLQEMDGLQSRTGVVVIGATNRPDCLDPALLRPGRFDRLVEVAPPDCSARAAIFGIHTRRMPLAPDVSLEELARGSQGFTGAAIATCCQEAALAALDDDIDAQAVGMRHFVKALASQQLRQRMIAA